jgi:gluconate 2-dehydrogenase gamma chain
VRTSLLGFGAYTAMSTLGCPRDPAPNADAAKADATKADAQKSDAPPALTAAQRATLIAACERILPRDQDPGATDLGCADYIERAMKDPDVHALFGRALFGGLTALDRQARTRFKKSFAEAEAAKQDELLGAWQKSTFSGENTFFDVLHTLTLEGAFGDPIHGGNRDGKGYELVGFVMPPPAPGSSLVHLNGQHGHHHNGKK